MTTIRRSCLAIAIIATTTLAWPDDDATSVLNDSLPEPSGVFVWVHVPQEVCVGQLVTIHVVIQNRRQTEPFEVGDMEISDGFLDGFELGTLKPGPTDIDHSDGTLTLRYGFEVLAQQSEDLLISLRAVKVGIFSGDIDVSPGTGTGFATRRLQTEVVVDPEK